jgi:hypothetical protein
MVLIAIMGVSSSNSIVTAQTLAGEESCEDKVERNGDIIRVTVCNRTTDFAGLLSGRSCNAESTNSCSITL